MTEKSVSSAALAELRRAVRGPVLVSGDPTYDETRIAWNGMFDYRRPAVIVQATGVADVQAAIAFARANDLGIAVRGGGHSVSGSSTIDDDGLLLDMSPLRGVHVDPVRRRAVVGAGTLLGEMDRETQVHGLAAPGGMISQTGVAGLTLGGGVGRFMRKVGLACDNVISFDMVAADGEWLHVAADSHPDLFWALRGGGGDFGVVTHFEFQLHPLGPMVYGGYLGWPLDQAKEVLAQLREEIHEAPDELQLEFILATAPEVLEFIPTEVRGRPILMLATTWMDNDLEEGKRRIAPFREKVTPVLEVLGEFSYAGLQAAADEMATPGRRFYTKTGYFDELTDEVIDVSVAFAEEFPSRFALIEIYQMGGAISRVPKDATAAYAFRDAGWYYIASGAHHVESEDEVCEDWVRRLDAAYDPLRLPGRYINFVADDDLEGQREAIGEQTFARLAEIKANYDPHGVFARNPNRRTQPAVATA